MSPDVDVLLFDLGGVLVEYTGVQDVAPLLTDAAAESDIIDRWARCPHTDAFCKGTVTAQEFARAFVRDWGLRVGPDEFLREFRGWSRRLYPGTTELFDSLRGRFRLAALSNSNAVHWDRNVKDLGIDDLFEMTISSHQVGLIKPDPAIYLTALARLGVQPRAVMFFDDLIDNVAAAEAVGIRAFQVNGVDGVRRRLQHEGLL